MKASRDLYPAIIQQTGTGIVPLRHGARRQAFLRSSNEHIFLNVTSHIGYNYDKRLHGKLRI